MSDDHSVDREVVAVWETNADYWDERMGEGNSFHNYLIEPTQLSLLEIKPGDRILDLACGNGQFSRKIASMGASVVAADGASQMIEHAKRRTEKTADITYHVADCTQQQELQALGSGFDAVVCTMALMDISDLEPLARSLPHLLKSNGRFVFSVMHPCFNSGYTRYGMECHDEGREVVREGYVRVSRYIKSITHKGIAMEGQPELQYYFHRPLQELLAPFLQQGVLLDGLREPVFPEDKESKAFLQVYSEIPAALVVRMRTAEC